MAHINTGINQPGIVSLLFYKPSTGSALSNLAHTLLQGPSSLSKGERELIAAYVSNLNDCEFCHQSHAAAANAHLNDNGNTVACVIQDINTAPISAKMKALLNIAKKVQIGGKHVTIQDINEAKNLHATDEEIHDTVLIAAAFCMYNRYVDGLDTHLPKDKNEYISMGKRLATKGYSYPPFFLRKFVKWMMNRKN